MRRHQIWECPTGKIGQLTHDALMKKIYMWARHYGIYSRITQINRRSMLHVGELKHEVDRTTVCIEFVCPCFSLFSDFLLLLGGGGAKASVILPKILPSSLFINEICIFGVWETITQKLRDLFSPNLVQWCIIPSNRCKENLAFVTSKMRIQEFFFPLHTADAYANVLTRTQMFRTAIYSHVRYFDPLVYLF